MKRTDLAFAILEYLVVEKQARTGNGVEINEVLRRYYKKYGWNNLEMKREIQQMIDEGFVTNACHDFDAFALYHHPTGFRHLGNCWLALRLTIKGRNHYFDHARSFHLGEREWNSVKLIVALTAIGILVGLAQLVWSICTYQPAAPPISAPGKTDPPEAGTQAPSVHQLPLGSFRLAMSCGDCPAALLDTVKAPGAKADTIP